MSQLSRLEVIETGARRRWRLEEKLRIVAESEQSPRQVSATARRYGLSTSQLFTWRRLVRKGQLCAEQPVTFAQALIGCEPSAPLPVARSRIEIVLASGLRVIVPDDVDGDALGRIIGVLERR